MVDSHINQVCKVYNMLSDSLIIQSNITLVTLVIGILLS